MRTIRGVILCAMAIAVAGGAVCAQTTASPDRAMLRDGRGDGPGAEEEMLATKIAGDAALAKKLGLTEQQVKALQDGTYEVKKEMISLRAAHELAALDQAKLVAERSVNEDALMKAVEKTGQIRTEMAKLRMKQLLLLKKTLKPEQVEAVKKLIRERAGAPLDKGRGNDAVRGKEHNGPFRELWMKRHGKAGEDAHQPPPPPPAGDDEDDDPGEE